MTIMFKKNIAANNETNGLTTNNASDETTSQNFETITMHSDRNPVVGTFAQPMPLTPTLMKAPTDGEQHSLKNFFERPIIVARGAWAITDAAASVLTTVTIPDVFLTQAMITSKVRGFLGFKGTACLRLQVNTNRFQMGRLFLNFVPQSTERPNKTYTTNQSLIFQTQLPRMDFDASTDSEITLEIPYINTQLMFNLRSGDGKMGVVNLIVYDPLQAVSGETTADWTLWCSFKDVQLEFPTIPSGFITQSGIAGKSVKRKTPSSIEQEQSGPISSVLSTMSKSVGVLNDIPLLSTYSAPTSWFLAAASKAASAFGFSNPINVNQQMIVNQQPMSRSLNDTGLDNSINIGLNENNSVGVLPGFAGVDLDEMALQHVLSIPTFFIKQVWSDEIVQGDTLIEFSLCPEAFDAPGIAYQYTTNPANTVASRYPTPINYFSKMFKYYHGSIRITIKVVKTEFHSGRLLIGYSPSDGTDPSHTNNDLNYVHREILDLRTSNEITLTFPFASTIPLRPNESPYGRVYVNVENDLRHPDTVPTTVSLLFEVSAAPDFKFAVPKPLQHYPVYLRTSPMMMAETQAGISQTIQKSGAVQQDTTLGNIGSSELVSNADAATFYCVGEVINSLRQVLKRANIFYVPSQDNVGISISPWSYVIPTQYFGYSADATPDYFAFVGTTFNYWRGSMRMRAYNYDYTTTALRIGLLQENDSDQIVMFKTGTTNLDQSCSYPWVVSSNTTYPFPEIQQPYYSKTATSISSSNAVTTAGVLVNETINNPHQYLYAFGTNLKNVRFTRQIGEDFSFGFFIGTQPLIPLNTTTFPNNSRV